jgi:hypothetical protein
MSQMPATEPPQLPRSRFVTVVAWFGMVSGACSALACLGLLLFHPTLSTLVGLVSGAATFVCAAGVRRRREWARRGFIALLGYSAVMSVIGALRVRAPLLADFAALGAAPLPGVTQTELDAVGSLIRTATIAIALVIVVVNGLVILKFCSRLVRREFDAAAGGP